MEQIRQAARQRQQTVSVPCTPESEGMKLAYVRLRKLAGDENLHPHRDPFLRLGPEPALHVVVSGEPMAREGLSREETAAQQLLVAEGVALAELPDAVETLKQLVLAEVREEDMEAPEFHAADDSFAAGAVVIPLRPGAEIPEEIVLDEPAHAPAYLPRLAPAPGLHAVALLAA